MSIRTEAENLGVSPVAKLKERNKTKQVQEPNQTHQTGAAMIKSENREMTYR